MQDQRSQSLTRRIAILSRFILRITKKCLPFFQALKIGNDFEWNDECEAAFLDMKAYFVMPPFLAKLKDGESLYVYLSVSEREVSAVHV